MINERVVIEEKFSRCPQCRSYSVKVTEDLDFKERIKGIFIDATAYRCDNCSHRFVEWGKFSTALTNRLRSLIGRVERKWLLPAVPAGLVVVVVGLIWLLSGSGDPARPDPNEKKPLPVIVKKTDPPVEQPGQNIETKPKETPDTTPDKTPDKTTTENPGTTPEPAIEIILGNSNRFGANWSRVRNRGVRITRLSNGPLKRAGIEVGDILSEVDGRQIQSGNYLIRVRNEIFAGKRPGASIKAYRGDRVFLYELVKVKKKTGEKTGPAKQPGTGPGNNVTKVFSLSTIKVRTSSPDVVDQSNRWNFLKKEVSVKRSGSQRVYVAGDPSGTRKWAVDDQLIINGKVYEGLTGDYTQKSGLLPENVKCRPLDITDLVPPGRETVLKISLADHGKLWANTDIYLIVKSKS
ncbi:MAG: hypothetical protein GY940_17615 [bacterium]|nr:hypothetical protein [bacterium]